MFITKEPLLPPTLGGSYSVNHTSPTSADCNNFKRKRRPAGTPDPDAEVVSLSPRTLMESDRYVCEICNQGFQRDQNLQMHRRRHKVPWKLLKRPESAEAAVRKRVFVCPETTCLHHDPRHALGDLVGIKKHFRRKHSNQKQWVCCRCSKGYAVQSDYKAHLKTCGTRGHSCDCGRVFSRVETFIEHQDACNAGRTRIELQMPPPQPLVCLSTTTSSPRTPSSNNNFIGPPSWPNLKLPNRINNLSNQPEINPSPSSAHKRQSLNMELQLLPMSDISMPSLSSVSPTSDEADVTKLQLSVGNLTVLSNNQVLTVSKLMGDTRVQLGLAGEDESCADNARHEAKRLIELAEEELNNAKRIRQQAHDELWRAHALREQATKKINAMLLEITCHACKQLFPAGVVVDENSVAATYISSLVAEH